MASNSTMRRSVKMSGGYYSSLRGQWVLPGAQHNCSPITVDTEFFATLEDAYNHSGEHAKHCRVVREFGDAEALYLATLSGNGL